MRPTTSLLMGLLGTCLLPGATLANSLYLTENLTWTPELPEAYLAEYEGEDQKGVPHGQGVGYFYGSLEVCAAVEADEVEETDPEIASGLCLEASADMAMYEGEWRAGMPWDGIVAQAGIAEAVIEAGVLNEEKSKFEEEDDD